MTEININETTGDVKWAFHFPDGRQEEHNLPVGAKPKVGDNVMQGDCLYTISQVDSTAKKVTLI